jgi:hypothetical protein
VCPQLRVSHLHPSRTCVSKYLNFALFSKDLLYCVCIKMCPVFDVEDRHSLRNCGNTLFMDRFDIPRRRDWIYFSWTVILLHLFFLLITYIDCPLLFFVSLAWYVLAQTQIIAFVFHFRLFFSRRTLWRSVPHFDRNVKFLLRRIVGLGFFLCRRVGPLFPICSVIFVIFVWGFWEMRYLLFVLL